MSVPSPASRQVALLIMITGLFAVVWSTDSGNQTEPVAASPSAIAILMQTTAVDVLDDDVVGWTDDSRWETECDLGQKAATTWPVTTAWVNYVEDSNRVLEADDAVVAPIPKIIELTRTDPPVVAPVPDIVPVMAPLPPAQVAKLNDWNRSVPIIEVAARRVQVDYFMTCHCCREYCESSSRRVAALKRQARDMLKTLAETVARTANGVDWKTRLSTKPDEADSPRRY